MTKTTQTKLNTQYLSSVDLNQLSKSLGERETALMDSLFDRHVPFYVRLQVSPYEAQAAKLLNELIAAKNKDWPRFNLFFCSSRLEAISGALKVVRHNRLVHKPSATANTVVLDPAGELQDLFDPLRQGVSDALIPGLVYVESVVDALDSIRRNVVSSILIASPDRLDSSELQSLMSTAKSSGIYTILDQSRVDLAEHGFICQAITASPDVIVYGENLSDHRAPCGCFMMASDIYKVWNTFGNYNLHSNTWGGNSASMCLVLDHLKSTAAYKSLPTNVCQEIESVLTSHRKSSKTFAKYNNPKMTTMMQLSNLNKDITFASSTGLRIGTDKSTPTVIDAAGTYGVNLRGHCPADYQTLVLHAHDPNQDYWSDLESVFESKTGLSHLFPAVSGTSGNDIAITMALMARFPKRRIIALEMGYHGKTLISLAATYKQRIRAPFGPLYPHVTFVDPFADNLEQQLTQLFEAGDVALVTLETIQGEGGVRSCPQRLFDFLCENRSRFGYLICVDEVQTGMYRTGRFLSYQGKLSSPDLVVLGKGMSDMIFPVAAAAVSSQVFQAACCQNETTVRRYYNLYRCQLGAHTALHAIASSDALGLAERASEIGDYFRSRLQQIADETGMVKQIRGEGLMIGFELDPSTLPKPLRGSYGGLIASCFANDPKNPVLVAFNPDKPHLMRFLPPLVITKEEIDKVLETTKRCLQYRLFQLISPLVANLIKPKVWFPQSV
jgi:acetylornithine/succinyldiaminopimelate/putrescine aminotransferase